MKKILILMSVAMLFASCTQGDVKEAIDEQNPGNKAEKPSEDSVFIAPGRSYIWAEFVVDDIVGSSLLNPSNPSPLVIKSGITIYSKKDEKYHTYNSLLDKSLYAPILDNQYGFQLGTPEQHLGANYVVAIDVVNFRLIDYHNDKSIASTVVDWGNGVRDTIDISIRNEIKTDSIYGYKYRNFDYDKMWVNGKLVWDETKADVYVDPGGCVVRLVMSEGKTSSTAYSRLKALQ